MFCLTDSQTAGLSRIERRNTEKHPEDVASPFAAVIGYAPCLIVKAGKKCLLLRLLYRPLWLKYAGILCALIAQMTLADTVEENKWNQLIYASSAFLAMRLCVGASVRTQYPSQEKKRQASI